MEPRRVYDSLVRDYGTAVECVGRNKYRVEWDDPTPYQSEAKVPVPSEYFHWAVPSQG